MKISKLVAGAALLGAGYLIGFFEVKYRTMKLLVESIAEENDSETADENSDTETKE